jgi:hypothetical protein
VNKKDDNALRTTLSGGSAAQRQRGAADSRSMLTGVGAAVLVLIGVGAGWWLHDNGSGGAKSAAPVASSAPELPTVSSSAPLAAAPSAAPVPATPEGSTALPSQAAPAAAAPVAADPNSVVGNWTGKFQWNGKPLSPMQWQFNADGTLLSTSGPNVQSLWEWRQRGNEVEMYLAGNTFYGTIKGTSMSGTMRVVYKNGGTQNTGIFDATRAQ